MSFSHFGVAALNFSHLLNISSLLSIVRRPSWRAYILCISHFNQPGMHKVLLNERDAQEIL